jgi:hypothetical protein
VSHHKFVKPEGTGGNSFGHDPWLGANESVLWEGRSAAQGVPIARTVVILFVLLGIQMVLAFTHSESLTDSIAYGAIEACILAGFAALVAWTRSHDRYVVTNQRAAVVRRNRGIIAEAPITSSKLSIRRTADEQTGTVEWGPGEWGPGKSSGARSVAEKLGLLSSPNVTFSNVEDPGGLAAIVRNVRTNLGIDTPDLV